MPEPLSLTIMPEFASLAESDSSALVLARIASTVELPPRPPARVVIALDISGSMKGFKLGSAAECACSFLEALGPEDRFALLTFNREAQVLLEAAQATEDRVAHACRIMRMLQADGGTNLSDTLGVALNMANRMGTGARVILLTDGCPTRGIVDPDFISRVAGASLGRAVLSTFGYGTDVNPVLLSDLARMGRGNYAYVEAGEPPLAALGSELGVLMATVATDVSLTIEVGAEDVLPECLTLFPIERLENGRALRIQLPPILGGEPFLLPLQFRWPGGAAPARLATLRLDYRAAATEAPASLRTGVRLPVTAERGARDLDVVREWLLSRAAIIIRDLSVVPASGAAAAIADLGNADRALLEQAEAPGIEAEPRVDAALRMVRDALTMLANGELDHGRHVLVARASSLDRRRSTTTGFGFDREEHTFTSITQLRGLEELRRNHKDGKKPPSGGLN